MDFTQIDELIESNALSTEEIVKHWIGTKRFDIGKMMRAYTCIPIDRAHLLEIKFGMIWYTDDTVSLELLPDKEVKSVVLGIDPEYNIIYGDTFIEKLDISKTEMDLFFDDHSEVELASEQKFARLTKMSQELNKILKKIGKPTWNGRIYWCAENISSNGMTTAHSLPNHKKIHVDANETHDFHPIYEYLVRY